MRKHALNFKDVNVLKEGIRNSLPDERIAARTNCTVAAIKRYRESLGEEEIAKLKAMGPTQVDQAAAIKAQVKAEIMAELGLEAPEAAVGTEIPEEEPGLPDEREGYGKLPEEMAS